jgi:pimeloyl-ACP methyl ester carboxylesterase
MAKALHLTWPPPPAVSLRFMLLVGPSPLKLVIGEFPAVITPEVSPSGDEPCTNPVNVTPPDDLLDTFPSLTYASGLGGPTVIYTHAEGRLVGWLRNAAQLQDPVEVLKRSAVSFYCAGIVTQTPPDTIEGATALADLAVTGRVAYGQFHSGPPQEADLLDDVRNRLRPLLPSPPDETRLQSSIARALDRAYTVAWALRDPNPITRAQFRASLSPGWIAVSGEDDQPDRPVNVASAPFPHFDTPVVCQGITIRTRYIIALPQPNYSPDVPSPPTRHVPGIPVPSIPSDHQIILFIPGLDSRAEEAADLLNSPAGPLNPGPLLRIGENGRKYAVIAFDLPSNGYSQMIDHTAVAPSQATQYTNWPGGSPATYPLLDFLVEFVISFVGALDQQISIKNRIAAVIGGSLGGNLCLRLAERNDQPWIRNIVAWSPASVWPSFNHDQIKVLALNTCQSRMEEDEDNATPPSRIRFFYDQFESPIASMWQLVGVGGPSGPPQPQQWYFSGWQCKSAYIQDARVTHQEIYNAVFRRWHWRAGLEQLLFSHLNTDTADGSPRYASNRTNTLLIAGQADNFAYANIYPNTQNLAKLMILNTPGNSLFLLNTGHSIHNERPLLLSQQILQFIA